VVEPGDDLAVGVRDDEWPAFVLVTTPHGAEGWVPGRFLELTRDGRGTPVRAYDTTEIEVDPGVMLTVLEPDLAADGCGAATMRAARAGYRLDVWSPLRASRVGKYRTRLVAP